MFTCVNALNSVAVRSNKLLDAERGCPTLGCLSRTGGVRVQPACEFERTPGCNRYERHLRDNRFLRACVCPCGIITLATTINCSVPAESHSPTAVLTDLFGSLTTLSLTPSKFASPIVGHLCTQVRILGTVNLQCRPYSAFQAMWTGFGSLHKV